MASVDVPIVRPTTEAAPKDYEIPAAQEIAPLAVRALVDGSGAATGFVPALQLISPGGQVMWTAPTSETVAAGASADVSWFPRVGRGGGGGADPHAIHYDVANETGGFIDSATTTGSISFWDTSQQGIYLTSGNAGVNSGTIAISAFDGEVLVRGAPIVLRSVFGVLMQDQGGSTRHTFNKDGGSAQVMRVGESAAIRDHSSNSVLEVFEDGNIHTRLPNADPGVSGALWNSGGFVAVSP